MHNRDMITAQDISSKKKPRKLKSWATQKIVLNCSMRELRHSMNLTIRDVERSGVDKSTIHRAERGFEVHLSHAIQLARFFQKSIEEIWQIRK
jgi:DNA-binding XRE family transcriptional regulator